MTSKELMYVEDALGHEQYFQTQFQEISNQIQPQEKQDQADEHQGPDPLDHFRPRIQHIQLMPVPGIIRHRCPLFVLQ